MHLKPELVGHSNTGDGCALCDALRRVVHLEGNAMIAETSIDQLQTANEGLHEMRRGANARIKELETAWRGEKDLHFKSGERVKDLEHTLEVCRADARRAQGTSHEEMARALKTITMTADNAIHAI